MPTQLPFDLTPEILEARGREFLERESGRVLNWLIVQLRAGVYHTRKTVEVTACPVLGMSRERVRRYMSYLLETGQLQENKLSFVGKRGRGGAYNYLNPTGFMVGANK